MELLDFCQAFQRETETLLVIIKNEDIISHLHQVSLESHSKKKYILGTENFLYCDSLLLFCTCCIGSG